jgi:hypothetical protein
VFIGFKFVAQRTLFETRANGFRPPPARSHPKTIKPLVGAVFDQHPREFFPYILEIVHIAAGKLPVTIQKLPCDDGMQ